MKQKLYSLTASLFTKLALVTALIVGWGNAAMADELTINGSASNTNYGVPFNGGKVTTSGLFGEFLVLPSQISNIADKDITGLIFYTAKQVNWGSASFTVCLKEVDNSYYESSTGPLGGSGTTTVYSGALSISEDNELSIIFDNPFTYSGNKSLLVRINCTNTSGTNAEVNFTVANGTTWSNESYMSYGTTTSATRQRCQPKVTFTYKEGTPIETPRLSVSSSNLDFGTLRDNSTQTITVSNTGAGTMNVSIANDNSTDFTVSATSLTGIGAGESRTFDVTFNYDAASLGDKSANITVTPSYDNTAAVAIAVTATAADASVWEDFDSGIPAAWFNENGSWLNYVSGLSGYASPGYNSNHVLRTPRLYAEAGQALGFDVKIVGKYSSNVVKAKYSTDRVTWSDEVTYSTDGTYSIEAPATGYYWVEFTASQAGIDNMTGWTIADATHDTRLGTATIPATGTAYGTYTASVVVKELGGSAETVNAELYFGETKVAEQTSVAVDANRDVTITLSYTPTEPFDGKVYIKVTGANISTLTTDEVDVVVSETPYVFDENSDVNPVISSSSVVKVKYTAQKGWNTIVMPFSLSSSPAYMNTLFGEGWTAYTIDSFDEGTLTFKSTTYMATTTPFLVYAPNAESHPDGVYLQNVSAGSYNWGHSNINQTKGDITFKGTFAPIAAPNMEGKYGVTKDGKLAKGGSGASIKAYHAYFELAPESPVKGISLYVINGDNTPTQIGMLQMAEGADKAVYNLSGQKVKNVTKGLYIINGKKVVVK